MTCFDIKYIKGEENTVVDALSHMPDVVNEDVGLVAATMAVSVDNQLSNDIWAGYKTDTFCQRILKNQDSFPAVKVVNGLIYIGSRLVIPRVGSI